MVKEEQSKRREVKMAQAVAVSLKLSERLNRVSPSATTGLAAKVEALKAKGINVISFGQGEPDFPTPAIVKEAGTQAIANNVTKYTAPGGTAALKKAFCARLQQDTNFDYAPNQVAAVSGAKEGLYLAFQALLNEGDEVIMQAPYWVSYVDQVHLAGGNAVIIPTSAGSNFKMTAQQVADAITPRTKIFLLNSPSNPTGAVYTATELKAIADVLRPHNILVMTDEIYDAITYGEFARWLRIAPDFYDRTIVVNGASKAFSMTGWRLGYVAAPKEIMAGILMIQSHSTTHPSSITQAAALAAYTPNPELDAVVRTMVVAFKERRDFIVNALNAMPGVKCTMPDGAFYAFPNVEGVLGKPLKGGKVCQTSAELVEYLLEEAHIAMVAGEAFGAPGYLRFSYALGLDQIKEGMTRMAEALI
jgi:aspartate aminotransferase